MDSRFEEKEFVACCGSIKFAQQLAAAAGGSDNLEELVETARDIWFNKVDVNGWLEAFAAHPQIGQTSSPNTNTETSAQWSKGEQSTALATSTHSTLQELFDWNAQYRQKFGFVFLICASGRTTPEILSELKMRYSNRPIVELEIAAQEQMKITELRLAKLFAIKTTSKINNEIPYGLVNKAGEDRVSLLSAHLNAGSYSANKPSQVSNRTRPPITTHVLDVSRGSPAAGIEVQLEIWNGAKPPPFSGEVGSGFWIFQGSSITNADGRSGHLMHIVDNVEPGVYRISFNTGKYSPDGFYPYVSIVFEIKESQKGEHFHVPILLSPFSFSTYRGS
ncbi:hypothetical protein AQUCO_04400142v1 [Aquilegia coerulea]|uniref:Uncharacterized protein n=1 Tax=Aquilegia coerulea TaxID=218851 RepID=A0A2G5CN80_AQUCA|nr:hypothetical protein AQUCO_04400142v1 [Aquilegia coerulea]